MLIRTLPLTAALLALAACEPLQVGPAPTDIAPLSAPVVGAAAAMTEPGAAPIAATQAIALFSAVCGGSLPNFAGAATIMAANGITVPSPSGTSTMYSATSDLSFKILDGPGSGRTCSMVFGTTEDDAAVAGALLTAFPTVRPDPVLGNVALFGDTRALVLIDDSPLQNGNTAYVNLRMLSER